MGYEEISIALSLAEKLPGGITDENVAAIMAQRRGPPVMGWGQIARKQGVKLGKVIRRLKRVDDAARKQDKMGERAEKAGGPARVERAERAERHGRTEKPGHSRR